MGKVDALRELLAKVDASIEPFPKDFPPMFRGIPRAISAYNGSLDAAMALHKIVLPEWHWAIDSEDSNGVCVFRHLLDQAETAQSSMPARAWLIAILKALITTQQAEEDGA